MSFSISTNYAILISKAPFQANKYGPDRSVSNMAFDGITIANLVYEFKRTLEGGKIAKIAQPEKDELLIAVKNNRETYRLQISASASLPLIYLTENNKPSPLTAPNFCMLLRKHIGSARIISITQPGLERILEFELEHLDEMGDLCRKKLIVEIMGKHSNIIFCKDDGTIIDSIKHVSANMSSVREVLPGREYFIPQTVAKENPLTVTVRHILPDYEICAYAGAESPVQSLYRHQPHCSRGGLPSGFH